MQPRIAAVLLAAGQSTRMGRNKLLEPLDGKPMVRHAAEAALASKAWPVLVVTGNEVEKLHAALANLPIYFQHNPDYSKGLATSLIQGLKGLPGPFDGAVILLGDMPGVGAGLIDRLIDAFDPAAGRAIMVPSRAGRRGNPVLWGRRFFDEIQGLSGDSGARSLFGRFPDLIHEVAVEDDAPFTDIDTEEALAAYRTP